MIYVNGQEISRLVLGCLEHEQWRGAPEAIEARPEAYLATLERWLERQGIKRAEISGFVIVQGPGSATALRTSHAMVNALGFALGVPVLGVKKELSLSDADALDLIHDSAPSPFALPSYTRAPNITATKRNALRRKII